MYNILKPPCIVAFAIITRYITAESNQPTWSQHGAYEALLIHSPTILAPPQLALGNECPGSQANSEQAVSQCNPSPSLGSNQGGPPRR